MWVLTLELPGATRLPTGGNGPRRLRVVCSHVLAGARLQAGSGFALVYSWRPLYTILIYTCYFAVLVGLH